jgi:hypothetical protein
VVGQSELSSDILGEAREMYNSIIAMAISASTSASVTTFILAHVFNCLRLFAHPTYLSKWLRQALPAPWHSAYPAPKTSPQGIRREDVLDMMKLQGETIGKAYVLIDLRRNDHKVLHFTPSVHGQGLL